MKSLEKTGEPRDTAPDRFTTDDKRVVSMHHKPTRLAPKRCAIETHDANEQADNLTDWQQQYDQVDAGRFYGRIDELQILDLQVYREHSSHTLHQQCLVKADALWFGIPSQHERCRINGQRVNRNDILCRPGSQVFELVTPGQFDMHGIVINKQTLLESASLQGLDIRPLDAERHARLQLPDTTLAQLRYLTDRIVNSRVDRLDGRIHHDLLIMALLEVMHIETPSVSGPPSYRQRRAVVDRIRQYLTTNGEIPLTVSELCEIGCVSRRTLQYSFESILDISPSQFLRVHRLNRVKRMLGAVEATSVSEAAAHHGFYHLSQFSRDYKHLFGELPSTTLARHRA